jgi:hypothetical protein
MDPSILTQLTQFGAAGLIGLLWIFERRQAAERHRQLDEAHRRIVERDRELDALLAVVKENTRAVTSLEHGQRRLIQTLERLERSAAKSSHAATAARQ